METRATLFVVDAKNRPLAVLDHDQILRQGLKHRRVFLLALGTAGRVVLYQRPKNVDTYPGRWDLMGNTPVPAGISAEETAINSIPPAVAHNDLKPEHLCSLPASVETGNAFVEIFTLRITAGNLPLPTHHFFAVDHDEMSTLVTTYPDQITPALALAWAKAVQPLFS